MLVDIADKATKGHVARSPVATADLCRRPMRGSALSDSSALAAWASRMATAEH